MKRFTILILSTFVLVLVASCTPASTPTPLPPTTTPTPVAPAGGDWVSSTEWGKLVMTVDSTGKSITKVSFEFSNFKCGSVSNSGTISSSGNRTITDGKFTIEMNLDPGSNNQVMVVNGTFDATGQKATGTWSKTAFGSKCSGTWEATAPK